MSKTPLAGATLDRKRPTQAILPAGGLVCQAWGMRQRRVWSSERKAELVAAWGRSGESRLAFCRREGLCYAAFARWVREGLGAGGGPERDRGAGAGARAVSFVEVRGPVHSHPT